MARRYTKEQQAFFRRYIPGHRFEKVAQQFNRKWPEKPITTQQALSYGQNHHISNGLHGHNKGGRFTEEQRKWLRKYIPGHHHSEVAEAFNRKWPDADPITVDTSRYFARNNRLRTGYSGKFEKGHKPVFAFPKGHSYSEATKFKKGHDPVNRAPVGEIRVRRYKDNKRQPETYIKVAEPDKWMLYKRWLWEQHNGPIPKGYFIAVRDGNSMNITIENLRMLPNAALGTLVNHADTRGEARDLVLSLGELRAGINRRRKTDDKSTE